VPDGWEDGWRAYHRPVTVGGLWIGPPWLESPPDRPAVVIDPGRAFGTGAHPTTRLCLELLLELPRGSLLDVGCGSGVLAIAAARVGFEPVAAIDADAAAVDATRRNATANGVTLDAWQTDALAEALPATDVAVANIALVAVELLAPRLAADRLVTSGYLAGERPRLDGYDPAGSRELDGWAAHVSVRRAAAEA
jgi:ribosomal protein L11 methyltransferase